MFHALCRAAILAVLCSACAPPAVKALHDAGLRNIQTFDGETPEHMYCADAAIHFTGVNTNGDVVSGAVCRTILLGVSIRYD